MRRNSIVLALCVAAGMSPALATAAADTLASFDGGIGVIPVSSGVGTAPTATTVNRNIVRGVQPPGQIWVIRDLQAEVKIGGAIKVKGKGLLLGGGNNIGTNAGASVFATLICGVPSATVTPTLHSTTAAGVPLAANGNFRIDDTLSPAPPDNCASPVLLIRNAANQAWFAAGIPDVPEQEPDISQMRWPFR